MYWGTTGAGWREADNSFASRRPGLKWGLAEGRAGGDRDYQTYALISNSMTHTANLEVTYIREDGVAINVESAIYWNSGGVTWEVGGNTVAPIP